MAAEGGPLNLPDSYRPAPYGRTCVGCSRAKTKCFYRPEGSQCERCHRLGKTCEQSVVTRRSKRPRSSSPPSTSTEADPGRLEKKLDDIVAILRSQAPPGGKPHSLPPSPVSVPTGNTPSSSSVLASGNEAPSVDTANQNPEVSLDMTAGVVHLLRPSTPDPSPSVLFSDVSVYRMSEQQANEQLDHFRTFFIPTFPCIHISQNVTASDLRQQKPFVWLLIMALTNRNVNEQFAMEETIWQIISQRAVTQHFVSLDILQGLIFFGAWSHYFKRDKPYMTMISQLAISVAFELDLHHDISATIAQRTKSSRALGQLIPEQQQIRTLEERRTILATYHLASSTWVAYRKTEPPRWTSYLENCLRILSAGSETPMDTLLAVQAQYSRINSSLIHSPADDVVENPSLSHLAALHREAEGIQRTLPPQVASQTWAVLYHLSTELRIYECLLHRRVSENSGVTVASNTARIQDLDSILQAAEKWLDAAIRLSLYEWSAINVDSFNQFTHCLVVLFKLSTLDEPGWDVAEVRRRADVFEILDQFSGTVDRVREVLGITDTDGPRKSLFVKAKQLFAVIRALFIAETPPHILPGTWPSSEVDENGGGGFSMNFAGGEFTSDDFMASLLEEPWLYDVFQSP